MILVGERIPDGLDELAPGPVLAALLGAFDPRRLNGHELVMLLRAQARQLAHLQAEMLATMAEVAHCRAGDAGSPVTRDPEPAEYAADEIRLALGLTRRAAEAELDLALRLMERLPQVWAATHRGDIDLRRAKVIVNGTDHLDRPAAMTVADRALANAGELTTGQLRALVNRLAIEVDPQEADARYQQSVADRRIYAEPTPDGTANLMGIELPPDRVTSVMRRINRLARGLRGPNETRTMDQLRADVYLDLLDEGAGDLSRRAGGRERGGVEITVDLETLAGLAERAGEIAGWGPVISDIARRVTRDQATAPWRVTVSDPDGSPVWAGTTRRRPDAGQSREIRARDRTCVFPGCRMPATDCDLDHRTPWNEGGLTTNENLAPLCRHDHRVKHAPGWRLTRTSAGTHRWTTPLGHTYLSRGPSP